MECEFTIALKYAYDSHLKPPQIYKLLKALEFDVENIDISTVSLDLVASYLHQFYLIQSPAIRSSVLRICCWLEILSPESITERYHFDYLIAASIDQKPPEPQTKIDDEKYCVFRYVSVLLKYRKYLPNSILRALVSQQQLKTNPYKTLILGFLCESSLFCDNVIDIPEICQIIIESLVDTGDIALANLISYVIEHRLPLIRESRYLFPILAPLTQFTQTDKLVPTCTSISYILRTWPGFLYFGIQNNGVVNLMKCLPHEPRSIIGLFRGLLKLDGTISDVTDGFCGLLLSTLLNLGLIEKLNQLSVTNSEAAAFLNDLLPFTSHSGVFGVDLGSNSMKSPQLEPPLASNSIIFDLAQSISIQHQVTTINGFSLQADSKSWDWNTILMLLTVVLPHNETEAQSPTAKQLYTKLFEFYTTTFLTLTPLKAQTISEPLFALINLLMSRSWGSPIIESNAGMKNAVSQTLTLLENNKVVDKQSSHWAIFKCITALMSDGNGISILSHWNFHDTLHNLGTKCTNPLLCEAILSAIKLYPEADLSVPVFWTFLSSKKKDIHQIAIADLRKKRFDTPNFQFSGFRGLLMPHIKELSASNDTQKLPIALNLLGEIISTDEASLITIANDKQLHQVLKTHSHYIYALLLARKDALMIADIDNELKWWMNEGNKKYLHVYDRAVECTFDENLDITYTQISSIFNFAGHTPIPPHLFGQLPKIEEGMACVKYYIPQLLEGLENKSDKEKRAAFFALAHFASVPASTSEIERLDVATRMINIALDSESYVLKGTLIAALSLFDQSKYLSSVLQKNNWQLFHFGNHQCVIPCDPLAFFQSEETIEYQMPTIEDPEGYDEITTLLKQMANLLLVKNTRTTLLEYYKAKRPELYEPKLVQYAHKLLSLYNYPTDSRVFIYTLFKESPLVNPIDQDVNFEELAKTGARITEMLGRKEDVVLKDIKIPVKTVQQIKEMNPRPLHPEVYLSDEDFQKLIGVDRKVFYNIPAQKMESLRNRIFE